MLLLYKPALLSTTSRLCTLLWLQVSPASSEGRRLYNLPSLFYFPPNLCRSPEIVMGKPLAPVSLLTKNHKKMMKFMKSSQHKTTQVLSNRGSKTWREFPYLWWNSQICGLCLFLVMPNISRALLEKVIVITNQINTNFPHSLFFISVGNDLIPLKTSHILPWRPQVTWMLLGCTICPILLSFSSATLPTLCAVNPCGYCHFYPYAGQFLSGHVAYLPSHCTLLILKHWTDNICMCIYCPCTGCGGLLREMLQTDKWSWCETEKSRWIALYLDKLRGDVEDRTI